MTVLTCIVGLLVVPGAGSTVMVQTQPSGKQFVRVFSIFTLLAMAAAVCSGTRVLPATELHHLRQVERHGFGPDLLDKTCARLC